ncbi:glycosyltransferase family 4 protein, partial [Candidatus Roizmanbacteria bacterium]|nr:glycosyltransferase family 4 protein [Candidatus Roizmanbacteria bacterium]
MRIGIDGNEANVKEQVGVSVYTRKLLEYFQKNADKTTQFRIYLRSSPIDILPPETDYFKYEVVFGPSFWLHLFLPLSLFFKRGIDIFFSPAHYIPRYCPVPIVTTIHDLSYFYYPQEFLKKDLYKLTNWTQFAIQKSAHLIAVSKTTKKDILQHYQVSDSHVTVVYNGFEKNASTSSPTDTLQRFELNHQEYILYVGTLQPRKNITILIES